ncbi:MAG: U32 family peptidase, partial [Syntrophomonadaceae bacterium]|nr:U32 family peptidase [Syntrophomonadaceae bacterium]
MELLAPAGNWQAFVAAVEAGADAVYVGGTRFSARQYADNFTLEQLRRAEEYAHLRDRRLYVAVNTLLDGGEMEEALEYCFLLQELGVDAVIVQDLGLMYLLRRTLPGLRVHASTQMSIHNAAGVALLQRCGVVRVVLARELSAADVASIHRQVPAMELECFVHGALCFSHSGQCLFSSLVGGRSGNRGRCAQPCRLPYSLLAGGREVRTRGEHLLSPADLCLLEALPSLQAAGVSSLKIEGRMKRPEYVATVTAVYRQALDALAGGHFLVREDMRQALEGIFNRTFTTGSWGGEGAHVLNIARPNNRGVLLGRVTFQHPDGRTGIHLLQPLRQGDGIEVWVRRGPNPALTVRELWLGGQAVEEVAAGQEAVVVLQARVGRGDRVFKTHDAALHARAQELMVHNRLAGRIPVWVTARLAAGQPLLVTLRDGEGNQGQAETPSPALPARTRAVSAADLEEKLSRLGATPLVVAGMELQVEEGLMVPFSEVN